jgi:hypothetical protein
MNFLSISCIINYLEVQLMECAVCKEFVFLFVEQNSGNLLGLLSVRRSSVECFVEP